MPAVTREKADDQPLSAARPAAAEEEKMASKLILIVEDSATDRRIAESFCVDSGYRVLTLAGGDASGRVQR